MAKLTMMGHIEDTARVLQRAIDERKDYGQEFIDFWQNNNFKKLFYRVWNFIQCYACDS
ncbi:hypothetical protein SDC49_18840 [Lactobacillus sp. R2/2]|nr:hypothetical protein [Lactobacillus sp. R2/2]